jgi:hypothetical protein
LWGTWVPAGGHARHFTPYWSFGKVSELKKIYEISLIKNWKYLKVLVFFPE